MAAAASLAGCASLAYSGLYRNRHGVGFRRGFRLSGRHLAVASLHHETSQRRRTSTLTVGSFLALTAVSVVRAFAIEPPAATGQATIPQPAVRDEHPFFATFSICAIDPEAGQSGVAVTTRVPFVGRAVPWARAGVGAVATQSWTIVEYGRQGLDLMEQGLSPDAALERLLADDAGRELRQLGLIDMQGRTAAHSGEENGEWAGAARARTTRCRPTSWSAPRW